MSWDKRAGRYFPKVNISIELKYIILYPYKEWSLFITDIYIWNVITDWPLGKEMSFN